MEPTCIDLGLRYKFCKICGNIIPETIEEMDYADHVPEDDYQVLVEPTCIEGGLKVKLCKNCGEPIDDTYEDIDPDPDAHAVLEWDVTKEATIFEDGERTGVCSLCSAEIDEVYKTEIIEWKYTTTTKTSNKSDGLNVVNDVLQGRHFYPNEDDPDGLDLYIEFSFLWNPSLLTLKDGSNKQVLYASMACEGKAGNDIYWMSLVDNAKGSDGKFAGGFEYTAPRTVEVGPAGMSQAVKDGPVGTHYEDFPNIGGSVPADGNNVDNGHEWGWHRLGVIIHEKLLNEDEIKAGQDAKYLVTITVYIDGTKAFELSTRESPDFAPSTYQDHNLLFTAKSDGAGGIAYTDISTKNTIYGFWIPVTKTTEGDAYAVFADYSVTAGTEFVQSAVRVDEPAANVYVTSDETEINAPFWYGLE